MPGRAGRRGRPGRPVRRRPDPDALRHALRRLHQAGPGRCRRRGRPGKTRGTRSCRPPKASPRRPSPSRSPSRRRRHDPAGQAAGSSRRRPGQGTPPTRTRPSTQRRYGTQRSGVADPCASTGFCSPPHWSWSPWSSRCPCSPGCTCPAPSPTCCSSSCSAWPSCTGHVSGALVGFGAGLLADLAPPADHAVGRYALVLCVIGYLGRARPPRDGRRCASALGPMLVVVGAALGSTLLYAGVGALVGDTAARHVGLASLLFTRRPLRPAARAVHGAAGHGAGQTRGQRPAGRDQDAAAVAMSPPAGSAGTGCDRRPAGGLRHAGGRNPRHERSIRGSSDCEPPTGAYATGGLRARPSTVAHRRTARHCGSPEARAAGTDDGRARMSNIPETGRTPRVTDPAGRHPDPRLLAPRSPSAAGSGTSRSATARSTRDEAKNNHVQQVVHPAVRGSILDARGVPLADNETRLVVSASRTELMKKKDDGKAVLTRLADVLDMKPKDVQDKVRLCDAKTPQPCWNGSPYQPIPVTDEATTQQALQIRERAEDFPGITAEPTAVRRYPAPGRANTAQVLGYLSPVTDDEITAGPGHRLAATCAPTRSAAPAWSARTTSDLRGKSGVTRYEVDNLGRVIGKARATRAQPGANVVTSIDARVQARHRVRAERGHEGRPQGVSTRHQRELQGRLRRRGGHGGQDRPGRRDGLRSRRTTPTPGSAASPPRTTPSSPARSPTTRC